MSSYSHFTLNERKNLQKLLSEEKSFREIASILGRSPSTISREVARNRAKYRPHHKPDNSYWYNSWRAQNLYTERRRQIRRPGIIEGSEEWNFVVAGLEAFWSPETIRERWHKLHPTKAQICISTIYRYVKEKRFPKITIKTHLRRRGKRCLPRSSSYNSIQPERIIPEWPNKIRNRERIGDLEGDTIYGGIGKGFLISLVDRQSRFLLLRRVYSRDSTEIRLAIEDMLAGFPVRSISFDNGSEFSEFHLLEKNLNTLVYFAEPHKPWQRGTNENTNDIVRFFFPKGCNLKDISDEQVQLVQDCINNRPKKCLGWLSPAEFLSQNSVALD